MGIGISLTNNISKYITEICKLGIFSINDEHFEKYVYGYGLHSCGDAKKVLDWFSDLVE